MSFVRAALPCFAGAESLQLAAPIASQALGDDPAPRVRMVDGDTLASNDRRIRSHGNDASEGAQTCRRSDGSVWDCGDDATAALARLVTSGVECVRLPSDRFGREVERCTNAEGQDGWAEMVRLGWAVAFTLYSRDYEELETQASASGLGFWQEQFERPEDYRRHNGGRSDNQRANKQTARGAADHEAPRKMAGASPHRP